MLLTRFRSRPSGRPAMVVAGLLLSASPAFADPSPALDRFSLSVGGFSADPKLNASFGTAYGALQTGDVKPGRVTMPRISADVLLGDSQGISFDYYRYKREYSAALTAPPRWAPSARSTPSATRTSAPSSTSPSSPTNGG